MSRDRYGQIIGRCLWWEPFYLAILAIPITLPDRFIPIEWHSFLVILLFVGWPLRWLLRHGKPLYYTPLRWPLMLILLWLPVNLWVAIDRSAAWIAAGHLLLGVALYVALINWRPIQARPQRLAYGVCTIGSLMALLAPPFIQWKPRFRLFHLPIYELFGTISIDILPEVVTETIHANVLAGVLVMILPLWVSLLLYKVTVHGPPSAELVEAERTLRQAQATERLLYKKPKSITVALWSGLLLITTLLILTQSRGAYLAGVAALGTVVLFRWSRLFYGLPLVALAIGWTIYRFGAQTVFELLGADNTFGGAIFRNEVWGNSVYALSDFVFTGIGLGNFNQVVPALYPFAEINGANAYHAHNLYLQIALDLGLPGAIAYGALVMNVFALALTTRKYALSSLNQMLAIGTVGSLAAMLIHGLLDAVTWGTKLTFVPWVFYAQIVLLSRKQTE